MSNKETQNVRITIESATVIRIFVLLALFLIGLKFLSLIVQPLVILFISVILALGLNPVVSWIAGRLKSKSRFRATGAAYLLVVAFLIGFFSLVIPPLVRQTVDFIQDVPGKIETAINDDSSFSKFIEKYNLDEEAQSFANDFGNRFGDLGGPVLDTAGTVGSILVSIIAVFVLTFMMLVEGPKWLERFWAVQPKKHREHRRMLGQKMYKVVVGYVNGQVFIAALGGTFAALALYILSIIFDANINPIALGGIVGIFALLPMVGTIIGATIAVLACSLVSVPLAVAAAIFFIVYQQIENATIQPYVQSKTNNLTPLIVFVAALIGVGFAGFLGALLAIPVAGCIKVLLDDHFADRLPEGSDISDIK